MVCRHIVVHHSATTDDQFNNWESIRNWHINERGWQDIGYHAGIEIEGGVFHIRHGRKLTENGAHCPGMNASAAGFCFVGNFTLAPPPLPMIQIACRKWFIPTMLAHGITEQDIFFHREKRQTECPGKAFDKELFLYILNAEMNAYNH